MSEITAEQRIAGIRARLAAAADSTSLILSAYDHGGGRLYTQEPERQLIADFYDAANRDFYVQALNDVSYLLEQIDSIPDQIARAVEAEREACAKMVEPHDEPATYSTLPGRFPSAAIRARGEAMKPCAHHRPSGLRYIAAEQDATERYARGERQVQCPDCKLWFWPHEMGVRP